MGTELGTPMRAVLCCDEHAPGIGWARLLLHTRVGGLSLLQRHLRGLRQAGIADVALSARRQVLDEVAAATAGHVPRGVRFSLIPSPDDPSSSPRTETTDGHAAGESARVLEQQADAVIDPRLLAQLVRSASTCPADVVCLDSGGGGNSPDAKSPYTAGVPDRDEARAVDDETPRPMVSVGVVVRGNTPGAPVLLDVGRYYWQRIQSPSDARIATRKILLSTMKPTDGFFARTNRRVSLPITRLLLDTPVTPNLVTVSNLLWALLTGWLFSRGQHVTFVLGSLLAWFSSMLDGVDGELARARFQTSAFGHWLEMVCDYAFYIALFLGLGFGVQRIKGDPIWMIVGVGASAGVLISFAMVARLKRAYARDGSMGDFYLAYQRTASAPGSNPFLRVTPYLMALMTRAGFPYLLVLIAIIDMPRGILVAIFISPHAFWVVAIYVSHLRVSLAPVPATARPARAAAAVEGFECSIEDLTP